MYAQMLHRSTNTIRSRSSDAVAVRRSNAQTRPTPWCERAVDNVSNAAARSTETVRNVSRETETLRVTFRRLAAVRALEEGWDGDAAASISDKAHSAAIRYLRFALTGLDRIPAPNIVPIADGGLQAEWYSAEARFEIYFEHDGEIAAWSENRLTGVEMEDDGLAAVQMLADWASAFDEQLAEIA